MARRDPMTIGAVVQTTGERQEPADICIEHAYLGRSSIDFAMSELGHDQPVNACQQQVSSTP
jgi:hypothetical protein